jgi:hypothetical protein
VRLDTGRGQVPRGGVPPLGGWSRGEEGREKEERESQRGLTAIFSKFSIETRKFLNTKVVENSKSYNFCFRHKLI